MIEKLILFYYYSFFSFETPLCSRPSGICIVTGFSENKSPGWLILIPLFCFRSCVSPTKAKQAGWQALHLTVMKALKTFYILLYFWEELKDLSFFMRDRSPVKNHCSRMQKVHFRLTCVAQNVFVWAPYFSMAAEDAKTLYELAALSTALLWKERENKRAHGALA